MNKKYVAQSTLRLTSVSEHIILGQTVDRVEFDARHVPADVHKFFIVVTQDKVGGHQINGWPSNVTWVGDVRQILTGADKTSILQILTIDRGANWLIEIQGVNAVIPVGESAETTSIDDTDFKVISGTNVQQAMYSADTALLNMGSTGIRYGGALTNQGSGVIRIAYGAGNILQMSNPEYPDEIPIEWQTTDLNLSGSNGIHYIYVNSVGQVTSTQTLPTPASFRHRIYLHRVNIVNGLYSAHVSIVVPTQQSGPTDRDIWRALGVSKLGFVLGPATGLSFSISEGEGFQPGAGFYVDPESPNSVSYGIRNPATFRHVTQLNAQTPDTTVLEVGYYDNNGTVTPIPGANTRCTINKVFLFLANGGNVRVIRGQRWYNSVQEALNAIQTGQYNPILPASYADAIPLGWIIAQKGATELGDGTQVFVTANRFGLIGGAVATSGAGALLAVNNLSDLTDPVAALAAIGAEGAITTGTTAQFWRGDKVFTNELLGPLISRSINDSAALGSELVANGTFTGSASGWVLGAGWAYGTDNVVYTVGSTTRIEQTINVIAGNDYYITWTQQQSVGNGTSVTPILGEVTGVAQMSSSTTGFSAAVILTATTTGNVVFALSATGTSGTVSIDNVSVKQITPATSVVDLKNASGSVVTQFLTSSSNTNLFAGWAAGKNNTVGTGNSFIGSSSGQSNTSGSNNSFVSSTAGQSNTTGSSNNFFGVGAGRSNTTGNSNNFIGRESGANNTTGSNNCAFGRNSALNNTTGNQNSSFGTSAGRYTAGSGNLLSADFCTFLGFDTRASATGVSYETVIGANALGGGNNTVTLGRAADRVHMFAARVYNGWTDPDNGQWLQLDNPNSGWTRISAQANGTGAANIGIAISPRGTGAISAHVPDNTATGGNARGGNSIDLQTIRTAASQVASGGSSVIAGGTSNTASGNVSVICGGASNVTSGTYAIAGGGLSCSASGAYASILGGQGHIASGSYSTISGGLLNAAQGTGCWVPGGIRANTRSITGSHAWSGARRSTDGDNQHWGIVLQQETTDATPTILTSDRTAPSTTNVMVLPNNSAYSGYIAIIARTSTGEVGSWLYHFTAKRGASAASMVVRAVLVSKDVTEVPTFITAVVSNTVRGSVEIEVTGAASTTIDWVADVMGVLTHR